MAKIVDVIKYEGTNDVFIWKHPAEDFNKFSQLIVHESQEAIFFMNGQALDTFGPGHYTLDSQNLPIVGKMLNRATGGESPFHCEVYFVNKTVQMGLNWGTDSKVRYIDAGSGIPVEIGASGKLNMMVSDSRKLLIKLVGTMNGIAWGTSGMAFTKSIQESFRPLISTGVKTNLAQALSEQKIDLFEVDAHLAELSNALRVKLLPGFEEYGLTIPQFYVTTVVLPEDEPNFKRLREMHTMALQKKYIEASREIALEAKTTEVELEKKEAEQRVVKAQGEAEAAKVTGFAKVEVAKAAGFAEAEVNKAQNISKQETLQAEVQKEWAHGFGEAGGSGGSMSSDAAGMMMGVKVAGMMFDQMGSATPAGVGAAAVAAPAAPAATIDCPKCGAKLPEGAKFCLECGAKVEILGANEILCPACGKKTQNGKFCMECGASLVKTCPKCGNTVPTGSKFCLECGEQL